MSSIVVLNMAKYTIISLILIDFVPIIFIFNLFQGIFRGSFRFKKKTKLKKVPSRFQEGDQTISIKSQVQKSPKPVGSSPLWNNSQVLCLFRLESFPNWRYQDLVIGLDKGLFGSNSLRHSRGVFEPHRPLPSKGNVVLQFIFRTKSKQPDLSNKIQDFSQNLEFLMEFRISDGIQDF